MTLSVTAADSYELGDVNIFSPTKNGVSDVALLEENSSVSRVGKFNPIRLTEQVDAQFVSKVTRGKGPAFRPEHLQAPRIVVNSVPGSVIRELGNGLVLAHVDVEGREVEITLPSNCFDFHVSFGTPFFLSMADRGGFSTPVVSGRDPSPVSVEDRQIFDEALLIFGQ